MTKPNTFTFVRRGIEQVAKHGLSLIYRRYLLAKAILDATPCLCPPDSPLEVHMQICNRDWLNGVWSAFSLRLHLESPFRFVLLSQPPIGENIKRHYRRLFPGVVFADEAISDQAITRQLLSPYPVLRSIWKQRRYFTLAKIIESTALANQPHIMVIDPDVVFFDHPTELVHRISNPTGFALFNCVERNPPHCDGCYCVDHEELKSKCNITLPLDFGIGLGVITPGLYPWQAIEDALASCALLEHNMFTIDQTISAIASAVNGFERLPVTRYAIAPVQTLEGVVARHYYSKTRDLMYMEALPVVTKHLRESGLWRASKH